MNLTPALRRRLAVAGTAAGLALITAFLTGQSVPTANAQEKAVNAKDQSKNNSGKEWPMFGGTLSRNLVNTTDKNIPTDWNNDPDEPKNRKNIKWVADLGSKAYGGPIIAGGKIFIGTNNGNPRNKERDVKDGNAIDKGVLMCFDQATGKFLWQAVFDKLPAGRVNDWPEEGICSSPVVEGDRLYFVCNRGELICASVNGYEAGKTKPTMPGYTTKTDAGVIWRLDMLRKLGVFPHNLSTCSPLIVGDIIFLITSNGVDEGHINIPNPEAPSFIAVNKKTGDVIWQNNFPTARLVEARKGGAAAVDIKKLVDSGLVMMHGQWSNPVYAEPNGKPQVIFPGGDGWLYAFEPKTGELIWKFDCNPKDSFYELGGNGTRNDFVCTPVVWENKLYIGVGQDPEHKKGVGHMWCIDITKTPTNKDKDLSPATKKAAKEGEAPTSILDPKDPANKDSGLVWHYGGFINPPPAKGRKWSFGRTLSTVCVHDGLLYTSELDGIVHCFDAKTGKQYWEHDMNADTWCSPYWVNGHVYIGNDKGKMLVFKHGKEKKLVSTIDMNCGYIRNTPVVVDGVMYFIAENPTQLWAIAAK